MKAMGEDGLFLSCDIEGFIKTLNTPHGLFHQRRTAYAVGAVKQMSKILNITVIFMITGIFLCPDFAYSSPSPVTTLRLQVGEGDDTILRLRVTTAIKKFVEKYGPKATDIRIYEDHWDMYNIIFDLEEALGRIRASYFSGKEFLRDIERVEGYIDKGGGQLAAILRYMSAWLARTVEKSEAHEEIKEVEFQSRYWISCIENNIVLPREVRIESITKDDNALINDWRYQTRYGVTLWEDAVKGKRQGFKLISVGMDGQIKLEGFVTFAEFPIFGLYLSHIEISPWNRKGRFKGVATVLLANVIEESIRRGYEGRIFSFPATPDGEKFFDRVGAKPYKGIDRTYDITPTYVAIGVDIARKILNDQQQNRQKAVEGSMHFLIDSCKSFASASNKL